MSKTFTFTVKNENPEVRNVSIGDLKPSFGGYAPCKFEAKPLLLDGYANIQVPITPQIQQVLDTPDGAPFRFKESVDLHGDDGEIVRTVSPSDVLKMCPEWRFGIVFGHIYDIFKRLPNGTEITFAQ